MAALRQPKVTQKVVPVLTDDELRRLLDTCRTDRTLYGRRDYAILRILVDTGMRRGEVVALTLRDVDLDAGLLIVRRSKTGIGRIVPSGAKATEVLDRRTRIRTRHLRAITTEARGSAYGGPLTGEGIRQMVMMRAKEAGVDGVFVHQFRHTYAHPWLAAGGQEHDLAQVAGWSNTAMLAWDGSSGR